MGTQEKDKWSRKYSNAEKTMREKLSLNHSIELKASNIPNDLKGKLFRSLNHCHKFAAIIEQKNVLERIFDSKKDKQRYLDYVYKIVVKKALEDLLSKKIIIEADIDRLYFYVDEHTTATNGKYELREGLEQELKNGTYNREYSKFFPPIFPSISDINLQFCNSKSKILIRSADIVANRIYYLARTKQYNRLETISNLYVKKFP